ncbi:MAG: pilus assembly protein [Anaerolineaceae bacterium]|jgi:pilus assembly protein Flp/PilA
MGVAKKQTGQGLIEYAFILVLVALIILVALALFGNSVGKMYSDIINVV